MIMAIAMVAMLAFGGTYAYFTAEANGGSDTVTTGKITLSGGAVTLVSGPVVSGEEILDGAITVTNASTVDSYVFVVFTASIEGVTATGILQYDVTGNGWTALDGKDGVYYRTATSSDTALTVTDSIKIVADNNYVDGTFDETSEHVEVEGKTVTVTLEAKSIQTLDETDGQDWTAAEAYAVLFPAA